MIFIYTNSTSPLNKTFLIIPNRFKQRGDKMSFRYSLRRAIHHEFYLQLNIEANAPKLIIDDLKRLRDYWYNKLTDEEKKILEQEVKKRLKYIPTEEERIEKEYKL